MFVCRWIAYHAMGGDFLADIDYTGYASWTQLNEAKFFSSKEEAELYLRKNDPYGPRLWSESSVRVMYVHPLNVNYANQS